MASELGELFVPAGVVVGELVVIEAEEVKEGAVDVADVVDAVDCFVADVIGSADGVACFGAAAREPHRHGIGVMIATVAGASAIAIVWGAAEFSGPDDEGVIEHAALFEVLEKGGDGFVDGANEGAVGALDVVVAVPVSGVGLDEADSFFDEASGQ